MAKFEDYDNSTMKRRCPRCGKNENAGAISVRISEFQDGNASRYHQLASRQISMCEECCTEVYDIMVEALNTNSGGGTRAPHGGTPRRVAAVPNEVAPRRRRRARPPGRR